MNTKWANEDLSRFRNQGDPEVDNLVEKLLPKNGSESVGTFGYNHMLLLADQLIKTPELATVKNSKLAAQLNKMPDDLVRYFDPMPAPDWVDGKKIEIGATLWQENTLMTLGVLYAASLPACYLIKNGIPALYESKKLREQQYIFQRIYETGMMLAATMDEGGIKVVADNESDNDKLLFQALKNIDAKGEWNLSGRRCHKAAETDGQPLDPQLVHEEIERLRSDPQRYLWGAGYISAKKVRFLHAAMRLMLVQNNQCCPFGSAGNPSTFSEALSETDSNWDFEQLGVPINQEDLAYTLLTFGLVIPKGLAHWGVPVSDEQRDGFLHLWKVVGHIMGIHSELLTDNWQEAEQLYALIQERQANHSEAGIALTEALMEFLGEYLPHLPGLTDHLSTALIVNQLGREQAAKIIRKETLKDTYCFWRRPIYFLLGSLARLFLQFKGRFYKRFKHLGGITANRIHEAAEHLIESWRGAYLRKPFFVPINATTWIRKPGVDEAYMDSLRSWRRRLFNTIVVSMGLLLVTLFGLAAAFPIWLFSGPSALQVCLGISVVSWLSFYLLMNNKLPVIFNDRPKIDSH